MKIKRESDNIFIEMSLAEANESLMWYGEYAHGELAKLLYCIIYEGMDEMQSLSAHQREIIRQDKKLNSVNT